MKANKFRLFAMVVALLGSWLTAGIFTVAEAQDYKIYRVEAFATSSFTVECTRGEVREIGLIGDGDNDLDLYVYDPVGRLVDSSEQKGDDEYVRWKAAYAGKYTLKVVNRGRVYSKYALLCR